MRFLFLSVLALVLLSACQTTTPSEIELSSPKEGSAALCKHDVRLGPISNMTEKETERATQTTQEACKIAVSYFASTLGMGEGAPEASEVYFLNQTSNVGGGCCFAENEGRRTKIFTDIDHEDWARQSLPWLFKRGRAVYWHQIRNGVHEYAHAVQIDQDAVQSNRGNRMPRWLEEGMAEYLAFDAVIRLKATDWRTTHQFQLAASIDSNEMTFPLPAYAPSNSPAWPGHIGLLVVAGLLDFSGQPPRSLLTYTNLIGRGASHDAALREVYGVGEQELYAHVEAWRQRVGNNEDSQPLWSK